MQIVPFTSNCQRIQKKLFTAGRASPGSRCSPHRGVADPRFALDAHPQTECQPRDVSPTAPCGPRNAPRTADAFAVFAARECRSDVRATCAPPKEKAPHSKPCLWEEYASAPH